MSSTELAIGFIFPVMIMIIAYWKEEVWLFYMASVLWLVFMGFLFNNYNSSEFLWYVAFVLLIPAIVCATAQLWLNKGKPNPIEPDKKETPSERRARKIRRNNNIKNNLSGKDEWE